jgi:hypothetical protein
VEWFKSCERFKQWEEEVFWLQREAVSVILSFHVQSSCWLAKAHQTPGQDWRAYCRHQRGVWNKLAVHVFSQLSPILQVHVLTEYMFCTAHHQIVCFRPWIDTMPMCPCSVFIHSFLRFIISFLSVRLKMNTCVHSRVILLRVPQSACNWRCLEPSLKPSSRVWPNLHCVDQASHFSIFTDPLSCEKPCVSASFTVSMFHAFFRTWLVKWLG